MAHHPGVFFTRIFTPILLSGFFRGRLDSVGPSRLERVGPVTLSCRVRTPSWTHLRPHRPPSHVVRPSDTGQPRRLTLLRSGPSSGSLLFTVGLPPSCPVPLTSGSSLNISLRDGGPQPAKHSTGERYHGGGGGRRVPTLLDSGNPRRRSSQILTLRGRGPSSGEGRPRVRHLVGVLSHRKLGRGRTTSK